MDFNIIIENPSWTVEKSNILLPWWVTVQALDFVFDACFVLTSFYSKSSEIYKNKKIKI